jgi:AcrR family transcriptional regulator
MKEKTSNFDRKKEIALSALLTETTFQKAAKIAGVSEVTLYRWLKDKDFSQAYKELKREAVSQAVARLQQISGQAVETLKAIMEDKDSPASVRVSAAKSILEMAIKAVELDDITKRIEDLEAIVDAKKQAKQN